MAPTPPRPRRHAGLSAPLAVGIAVLSACPGGTASNIVAFLARGEMAVRRTAAAEEAWKGSEKEGVWLT